VKKPEAAKPSDTKAVARKAAVPEPAAKPAATARSSARAAAAPKAPPATGKPKAGPEPARAKRATAKSAKAPAAGEVPAAPKQEKPQPSREREETPRRMGMIEKLEQVRIVIEGIKPQVDCGRFAIKAIVGDRIEVGADIWKDGHDLLKAAVLWRKMEPGEWHIGSWPRKPDLSKGWREAAMTSRYELNDRWFGSFVSSEIGPYAYTVLAWTDVFGSWRDALKKKAGAGQEVSSELLEGMRIIERYAERAGQQDRKAILDQLAALKAAPSQQEQVALALGPALLELMERNDPRGDARVYPVELQLWVDREKARFGSWYEIFPRSQGTDPTRSAAFREAEARVPEIAAMGFDVLYLTPIHPIGHTARKGKNNTERAEPGDVGSPWAIGSEAGGHDAVEPSLGTIEDFDHFEQVVRQNGMEIALDFAVQCSPDHPWVKEHPEWFSKRPDGTIKYAENPPKKYQDIYPINFDTEDREGLYQALLDVVLFWIGHGVKIFRVDNPHTKPVGFWEWLIAEVHKKHPDVIFLAEAFTRPKRLKMLAKAGFTQSYTYFTWRNSRAELEEFATELFLTDVREYLRPNFFVNTPDILHEILQRGGRPAFLMRLVLGATLSPTYGIYSGYELLENIPLREGSEEYLDSEKYQIRVRDWHAPGNIIPFVTKVNSIRRAHYALQLASNLQFLGSTNPNIIAYAKWTPDRHDTLVVAVNVDPHQVQDGLVHVPPEIYGGTEYESYRVTDLLTGASYTWRGPTNYVKLNPHEMPAHILQVERVR
jgi:starch synthase (maltosyl-transferring)